MYRVSDLVEQHGKEICLSPIGKVEDLSRPIYKADVHYPGLGLTGHLKGFAFKHILIFGEPERTYLEALDPEMRYRRLSDILTTTTPAVILARGLTAPKELKGLCKEQKIPLFRSKLPATELARKISFFLGEEFCQMTTLHGTLVEVFGVGVLIQGESSVGKSEAALGLIEKGHRLISDDVVRVKKKEGSILMGSGPDLTQHLMEIRGIGIINVAHLYGAVCVRPHKGLNLVVKLEPWDEQHFYDRIGLDEKFIDILDVSIPYHTLPVKPGRDVVLLLETIALNYRLKSRGYHSAREFNAKLLEAIVKKKGFCESCS